MNNTPVNTSQEFVDVVAPLKNAQLSGLDPMAQITFRVLEPGENPFAHLMAQHGQDVNPYFQDGNLFFQDVDPNSDFAPHPFPPVAEGGVGPGPPVPPAQDTGLSANSGLTGAMSEQGSFFSTDPSLGPASAKGLPYGAHLPGGAAEEPGLGNRGCDGAGTGGADLFYETSGFLESMTTLFNKATYMNPCHATMLVIRTAV